MIHLKRCFPVLLRPFSGNSILYRYSSRFKVKLEGVDLKKIVHAIENGVLSPANLEHQARAEIMSGIRQRKEVLQNLEVLKDLEATESQPEMKKWILDERQTCFNSLEKVDAMLTEGIFSICEPDNVSTVFLEVSGKVGGLEAMLFAHELFEMYCNFIEHMGWDKEIVHYDPSSLGGMRHATLIVSGENVYRMLRYEAGVHRVQRVPTTEKHGRMHTSTVSVSLIPRPNDIETIINEKDIRIETKRASGAGGQHVNTTDSAVRIIHIPTGISTECQSERSQLKNKELAMKKLQYMLYQQQSEAQEAEKQATKKFQVGTSHRNEKIRTYNFTQDRITDHRIKNGTIHNIKAFLEGGDQLEHFIISIMLEKFKEEILKQISDHSELPK